MYTIFSFLLGGSIAWLMYSSGNQANPQQALIVFVAVVFGALIIKRVAMWFIKLFALLALLMIVTAVLYFRYQSKNENFSIGDTLIYGKVNNTDNQDSQSKKNKNENNEKNQEWHEFAGADIDRLISNKEIIVVNLTSEYCLTCYINNFTTLNNQKFLEFAKKHHVHLMQANIDTPHINVKSLVDEMKIENTPTTVIFSRKNPHGKILNTVLTASYIIEELEQQINDTTNPTINEEQDKGIILNEIIDNNDESTQSL